MCNVFDFIHFKEAIDNKADFRLLVREESVDWLAQQFVFSDVGHRTNVTLYPQIYQDEQGDLFDLFYEQIKV